jgi:hypothetical protein
VSECDREASIMRRPWPTGGCGAMGKKGLLNLRMVGLLTNDDLERIWKECCTKKSSLYLCTIPIFTRMNTIADDIRAKLVSVISHVPYSLNEFGRSFNQMVYEYFIRVSRTSSLHWVCNLTVILIYSSMA